MRTSFVISVMGFLAISSVLMTFGEPEHPIDHVTNQPKHVTVVEWTATAQHSAIRDALLKLDEGQRQLKCEWKCAWGSAERLRSIIHDVQAGDAPCILAIGAEVVAAIQDDEKTQVVGVLADEWDPCRIKRLPRSNIHIIAPSMSSQTAEVLKSFATRGRSVGVLGSDKDIISAASTNLTKAGIATEVVYLPKAGCTAYAVVQKLHSKLVDKNVAVCYALSDPVNARWMPELAQLLATRKVPLVVESTGEHCPGSLVTISPAWTPADIAKKIHQVLLSRSDEIPSVDKTSSLSRTRVSVDLTVAEKLGIDVPKELLDHASQIIQSSAGGKETVPVQIAN